MNLGSTFLQHQLVDSGTRWILANIWQVRTRGEPGNEAPRMPENSRSGVQKHSYQNLNLKLGIQLHPPPPSNIKAYINPSILGARHLTAVSQAPAFGNHGLQMGPPPTCGSVPGSFTWRKLLGYFDFFLGWE